MSWRCIRNATHVARAQRPCRPTCRVKRDHLAFTITATPDHVVSGQTTTFHVHASVPIPWWPKVRLFVQGPAGSGLGEGRIVPIDAAGDGSVTYDTTGWPIGLSYLSVDAAGTIRTTPARAWSTWTVESAADDTPPVVFVPTLGIVPAATVDPSGRVPVIVTWSAVDDGWGLARIDIRRHRGRRCLDHPAADRCVAPPGRARGSPVRVPRARSGRRRKRIGVVHDTGNDPRGGPGVCDGTALLVGLDGARGDRVPGRAHEVNDRPQRIGELHLHRAGVRLGRLEGTVARGGPCLRGRHPGRDREHARSGDHVSNHRLRTALGSHRNAHR